MNLEYLVTNYKKDKIGNPQSIVEIGDIPSSVTETVINSVLSSYDLEDEKYSTKENVFFDTRRIVARNNYNKRSEQLYSNLDFDDNLIKISQPIIQEINAILPAYVPLLMQIATILPGQSLKWHIDVFLYQQFANKLHIPLITNDESFFDVYINDKVHRTNMKVGKIYNINNLALHRSINSGSTSRSHLIIDFIDTETLNVLVDSGVNFFHTRLDSMSKKEETAIMELYKKYKK